MHFVQGRWLMHRTGTLQQFTGLQGELAVVSARTAAPICALLCQACITTADDCWSKFSSSAPQYAPLVTAIELHAPEQKALYHNARRDDEGDEKMPSMSPFQDASEAIGKRAPNTPDKDIDALKGEHPEHSGADPEGEEGAADSGEKDAKGGTKDEMDELCGSVP
jgi:hypothetical protein